MKTISINKLVRDQIPNIIKKDNKKCTYRFLNDEKFIKALKQKLIEESNEVEEAISKSEIIEELADVYEVTYALMKAYDIDQQEVEEVRINKSQKNGAFSKRIYLESVEE